MLTKFLLSLAELILKWVGSQLIKKGTDAIRENAEDKEIEAINAENIIRVQRAKTRLERIKANEDLLNRTPPERLQ